MDLLKACKEVLETKPFNVNGSENIVFTNNFCYLGSILDFLLDNTSDIKLRMSKAEKAIGALSFM